MERDQSDVQLLSLMHPGLCASTVPCVRHHDPRPRLDKACRESIGATRKAEMVPLLKAPPPRPHQPCFPLIGRSGHGRVHWTGRLRFTVAYNVSCHCRATRPISPVPNC